MRKIKLLTTLTFIGILGTSIPLMATSCSKTDEEKIIYQLRNVTWSRIPQVNKTSTIQQFEITRNGSTILPSFKEYVDDGSSPELGVDSSDITKITPTKQGDWTYKVKVVLYKDGSSSETETTSLSIPVHVAGTDGVVTKIVNDESVSLPYAIATEATRPTDVVGRVGVKFLNKDGDEIPAEEGKEVVYSIDTTDAPFWLLGASINSKGEVSMNIQPVAVDWDIEAYNTTWTAKYVDESGNEAITTKQHITLWCSPEFNQNGLIVCNETYKKYTAIGFAEKMTSHDVFDISKEQDGKITFNNVEGDKETVNVQDIVYLSIQNVEKEDEDRKVYMVYENFCHGWENLCYVDLRGLADIEIVGRYAFSGCTSLFDLNLSGAKNLRVIFNYAFSGCTNLQSIDFSDIDNKNTLIFEPGVLYGCTSLKKIDISSFKNGTVINEGVGYDCTNLEEIVIGDTDPSKWVLYGDKDYLFSNSGPDCVAYQNGVKITGNGTNEQTFKQILPDTAEVWKYRKLKTS